MSIQDRERWDAKYSLRNAQEPLHPSPWLPEALNTFQGTGRACDLACGLGDNAIFLAQQGWNVTGVDVSSTGLKLAEERARAANVSIRWIASDLENWQPDQEAYDLICVFRFLDRMAVPRIVQRGLRPGGILVYETFGGNHLQRADVPMRNPDFVLQPGELPLLFPELKVVESTEVSLPEGDFGRFIGRRPKTA